LRRRRTGADCGGSEAILSGSGLLGLLHATSLRRSIPQITLWLSDTDQFDLLSAAETVGDMIRIPGGVHA
jgi:hypothetical protein